MNNMAMDGDRFFKVRPLFEHLNQANKDKEKEEFYSFDEIMVPYYGRHGNKQYIRGKLVRFGFKLWAIFAHQMDFCIMLSHIVEAIRK